MASGFPRALNLLKVSASLSAKVPKNFIFEGGQQEQWLKYWVVATQIFFIFIPTWGNDPIMTNIFEMGWNHQLEYICPGCFFFWGGEHLYAVLLY